MGTRCGSIPGSKASAPIASRYGRRGYLSGDCCTDGVTMAAPPRLGVPVSAQLAHALAVRATCYVAVLNFRLPSQSRAITVRLRVTVAPSDTVKSIEAPGGDRVLAKAAEDAVYKWEVREIAGRNDGVDRIPLSKQPEMVQSHRSREHRKV